MKTIKKLKKIFGSYAEIARAAKRTRSAVLLWDRPRSQGGTGGRVPNSALRNIIKYADKNEIELNITMEDFV